MPNDWYKRYMWLSQIEADLANLGHQAGDYRLIGDIMSNLRMQTSAKQVQVGIRALREEIQEMREMAFESSGAVRVPVETTKPILTLLKGGVKDET